MKGIIIFSHGFGVGKDDRGLFNDIALGLGSDFEAIMFSYNEVDELNNTITVKPLSKQAQMLNQQLESAAQKYPGAQINLICHSQGCVVAGIASPVVDKIILLAPLMSLGFERIIKNFSSREGTVINLEGQSVLAHKDGSKTLIGTEYVKELKAINPTELYEFLAQKNELTIVCATADEVLGAASYEGIDNVRVVGIKTDHNFTGEARIELVEVIGKELK